MWLYEKTVFYKNNPIYFSIKFIIIEIDGVCLTGITKYGFAIKINYDEIKSVKIRVKQEEGEHACSILGNEVDTLVIQTKDKKFLYPIRMYNQKQRQEILEIFSHKLVE